MEDFDLERYASKKWFLTNRMLDNSDEFFDYGKGKCDYHRLHFERGILMVDFNSDRYDHMVKKRMIPYQWMKNNCGISKDFQLD